MLNRYRLTTKITKPIQLIAIRCYSNTEPPEPPTNCCGRGCERCVWDNYNTQLLEYQEYCLRLGVEPKPPKLNINPNGQI